MSFTSSKPSFVELPPQRPRAQREYTASPTQRHDCTPRTPHGFIPLGTSSPLPTTANRAAISRELDYFSIPRKESLGVLSPHATQYEPHGFIPLCSVAVVEKGDEAEDYFSMLARNPENHDEWRTATNISESSGTPTPRLPEVCSTSHLPVEQLTHPTGSPVLNRDVLSVSHGLWKPKVDSAAHRNSMTVTNLRGGGTNETNELLVTPRATPTCNISLVIKDALDGLEENNRVFDEILARLENDVLMATTMQYSSKDKPNDNMDDAALNDAFDRYSSYSSLISTFSRSTGSSDADNVEASTSHNISLPCTWGPDTMVTIGNTVEPERTKATTLPESELPKQIELQTLSPGNDTLPLIEILSEANSSEYGEGEANDVTTSEPVSAIGVGGAHRSTV